MVAQEADRAPLEVPDRHAAPPVVARHGPAQRPDAAVSGARAIAASIEGDAAGPRAVDRCLQLRL